MASTSLVTKAPDATFPCEAAARYLRIVRDSDNGRLACGQSLRRPSARQGTVPERHHHRRDRQGRWPAARWPEEAGDWGLAARPFRRVYGSDSANRSGDGGNLGRAERRRTEKRPDDPGGRRTDCRHGAAAWVACGDQEHAAFRGGGDDGHQSLASCLLSTVMRYSFARRVILAASGRRRLA